MAKKLRRRGGMTFLEVVEDEIREWNHAIRWERKRAEDWRGAYDWAVNRLIGAEVCPPPYSKYILGCKDEDPEKCRECWLKARQQVIVEGGSHEITRD